MAKRGELKGVYNIFFLCSIVLCLSTFVLCDIDVSEDFEGQVEEEEEVIEILYKTPSFPPNAYLFEPFDDESYENRWVKSQAKKEDVDEDIAKYNGLWSVEPMEKDALSGDYGLVLKSKAKHAAISAKLNKPFVFKDKPFVVQYEVNLQDGQECGGAYIKLLSDGKESKNLKVFNDKTPYTIMFGPDKCGNDHKLHFIFRHVNPITKAIEEKHCKRPKDKLESPFKDKKVHLYTLILRPDNTFEILFDHEVINSGHLLDDFTPPVNPAKEIDDPNDAKPSDWDEREKIPDPTASKPSDWDEDAPRQIIDNFATIPEGWLEDEPELIPDPAAVKPEDWDDEMDGEWEAPLVMNPVCEGAPGCGKWKRPMIENPDYKGKWKPPMIDNPNYKGKWAPRKIQNPDYFEDLEPFKMTPVSAVGLELWSMSDRIYFDNFLVTDSVEEARQIASDTFDLKIAKLEKGQVTMKKWKEWLRKSDRFWVCFAVVCLSPVVIFIAYVCYWRTQYEDENTTFWDKVLKFTNYSPWMWLSYILYCTIPISFIGISVYKVICQKGFFANMIDFSNEHPWIYGVYVLVLAIPVVLVFVCCCAEDVKEDKDAQRKKTDEPTADDVVANAKEEEEDEGGDDEEEEEEEPDEEREEQEVADEEKIATKSESEVEKSDDDSKKSPRLRKLRKE